MQAIVNIELDSKSVPGADLESRHSIVAARVRKFFTRAISEIREVSYEGPDGKVTEHTAVITFEFNTQKSVVLSAMNQVARDFNQDCVAVLFSDREGRLVGPEADRWGGFKIEYFKRPAFYEILQEAA
jgi:hypothetical protein